jgi:hypothetical protein
MASLSAVSAVTGSRLAVPRIPSVPKSFLVMFAVIAAQAPESRPQAAWFRAIQASRA